MSREAPLGTPAFTHKVFEAHTTGQERRLDTRPRAVQICSE
jgi:hypothetical protein